MLNKKQLGSACGNKRNQDALTVIIPNYNKEKYVRECVQSVLNQTFLPDEIVIVDDCSTDSSREIINDLCVENSLVKAIYLDKNAGVSHARNIGLRAAKSNFVTFLDSDDFYANKYKLQNEMALIDKHGADIIAYSKLKFADLDGNIIKQERFSNRSYLTGNIFFKMLIGKFKFATIARDYCIKRNTLIEIGGYNEDRNLYEDLELLLKLARNHLFFCTYEFGTAYRQVPGGLSKRRLEEHKKARDEIFYENLEAFSDGWRRIFVLARKGNDVLGKASEVIWKIINVLKVQIRKRISW
ncbi:MAG: glycosyltransferase family 2 protein [Blautia sp.]|nr:glycosyltransferase family 2 protein [Blautia sp.]